MAVQRGGNIPVYTGYAGIQRGSGLGSVLGAVARGLVPVLRSTVAPVARRVGKTLLRQGVRHAGRALKSVSRGQSIKKAVSRELAHAMEDAKMQARQEARRLLDQSSGGRANQGRRKRKRPNNSPAGKRARQVNALFA